LIFSVFVNRNRDVVPVIRQDCIQELGKWIEAYPAQYLDNNYLKFLAWGLSDKDAKVRKEALEGLKRLYEKDTFVVALESVTTRFRPRIISMLNDVDKDVRVVALDLAVKLLEYGSLFSHYFCRDAELTPLPTSSLRHGRIDEAQKIAVRKFLADEDSGHRAKVAKFVATEIENDHITPKVDELAALGGKNHSFLFLSFFLSFFLIAFL